MGLGNFFEKAGKKIGNGLDRLGGTIGKVATGVGNVIEGGFRGIRKVGKGLWNVVAAPFRGLFGRRSKSRHHRNPISNMAVCGNFQPTCGFGPGLNVGCNAGNSGPILITPQGRPVLYSNATTYSTPYTNYANQQVFQTF